MITTNFVNNSLEVYKNNRLIINQPFKPTSDGSQLAWINEQDALDWWNTIKDQYDYEISEEQPISEETIPVEQSTP